MDNDEYQNICKHNYEKYDHKIKSRNKVSGSVRCTCNSLTQEVADTNSLTICKLDMAGVYTRLYRWLNSRTHSHRTQVIKIHEKIGGLAFPSNMLK